MKRRSF